MHAYHLIIVRNTKIILERVRHSFAALSVSISPKRHLCIVHTYTDYCRHKHRLQQKNKPQTLCFAFTCSSATQLGNWIQWVRRTATKAKRNHHIHMSRVDRYLLLEAVRHKSKYTGCFIRRGPFSRAGSLH